MSEHFSKVYFNTQSEALNVAFEEANRKGYKVDEPQNIWTEHVAYGKTVKYTLNLIVERTGNPARKCLHISLYRMDSGRYELTHYIN